MAIAPYPFMIFLECELIILPVAETVAMPAAVATDTSTAVVSPARRMVIKILPLAAFRISDNLGASVRSKCDGVSAGCGSTLLLATPVGRSVVFLDVSQSRLRILTKPSALALLLKILASFAQLFHFTMILPNM